MILSSLLSHQTVPSNSGTATPPRPASCCGGSWIPLSATHSWDFTSTGPIQPTFQRSHSTTCTFQASRARLLGITLTSLRLPVFQDYNSSPVPNPVGGTSSSHQARLSSSLLTDQQCWSLLEARGVT